MEDLWTRYWGEAANPFAEAEKKPRAGARVAWVGQVDAGVMPLLTEVELLEVGGPCSAKQLEMVAKLTSLHTLSIRFMSGIRSFDALTRLPLRRLLLEGSTKASLEPLGALPSLEALCLRGSGALDGGFTKYPTFTPLRRLTTLRYFDFTFVRASDAIDTLASMTWLERLDTDHLLSLDDRAQLAARLLSTRGDFRLVLHPISPSELYPPCGICGRGYVRLSAAPRNSRLVMCAGCDAAELQQHVDNFEAKVAKHRARA